MDDRRTFLFDAGGGEISYGDFVADINAARSYPRFLKPASLYDCFKNIALAVLAGGEIALIDSDCSEEEISRMLAAPAKKALAERVEIMPQNLKDSAELAQRAAKSENFKAEMFTSGSTGEPKKVSQKLPALLRFFKKTPGGENDVWGFAYSPTHIAGVQVFFQALLNGSKIAPLFGLDGSAAADAIASRRITHISATPTFYRLLRVENRTFPSVVRLTSGGERFDERAVQSLRRAFPNAKITNVYASTEAGSLFASRGGIFTPPPDIAKFVKIENGELAVSAALVGESAAMRLENGWYFTGDIAEKISDSPLSFRIISRKCETINTGGYKVEPSEVEDAILRMPEVSAARVFGRKNSVLGNVVCAEIVGRGGFSDEIAVRKFLKDKLQNFKIPRLITFARELKTTSTGKTARI
ncbi:MAG: long-chain fatty acid--CoA ligase [Opitutales bacterium]|nr:long-chain fatty acid--CoA ligase [Opitutales bacterium]